MGFYDHPIVDNNSKRSEESVNVLRPLFSRKNGFIFREENPDYGVDVDVELITDDQNVSSWKFAIQIKSKEQLKIITERDEQLISLPFEVSRLGYLSRRAPAFGLVVAYGETDRVYYYDYVENIISRLDNHPNRVGWRDQETVNLLFPLVLITDQEVAAIHKKMLTRHENHARLISEHGKQFNIPNLQYVQENPGKVDFSDPKQIADYLIKFGSYLVTQGEFSLILGLLGRISQDVVNNSLDLVFLSAITYTQTGSVTDAEYFLRKINKRTSELSDEQKGIIQFSQLRVAFLKGDVNYKTFLEKISTIKAYVKDPENVLTIEINELFFQLTDSALNHDIDLNSRDKIDELTNKIDQADLNEGMKHLLLVYHSENIQSYALEIFLHFYSAYQMKLSMNIEVPTQARIDYANLTIAMNQKAMEIVHKAYVHAEKEDLKLLKATAAHNLGKFFYYLHYYLLMQGIGDEPELDEGRVKHYRVHQNFSLIAFNQFRELHMMQNAHEALTLAYDLQYLCLKMHLTQIGPKTAEELIEMVRNIEAECDLQPWHSSAEIMIAGIESRKAGKSASMADLTDDQITFIAKNALTAYNLPAERLVNIIAELKTIQIFTSKCSNKNIELKFNLLHHQNNETRYANPPEFILRHKTLNYETKPSTDIYLLLAQFKHLL